MSGTQAGYEWAKKNKIIQNDVDSYSGNSESFRKGMQQYVDEQGNFQDQVLSNPEMNE
jgi:hypothetical protein